MKGNSCRAELTPVGRAVHSSWVYLTFYDQDAPT